MSFYHKCGTQLPDNSSFCNKCGATQNNTSVKPTTPLERTKDKGKELEYYGCSLEYLGYYNMLFKFNILTIVSIVILFIIGCNIMNGISYDSGKFVVIMTVIALVCFGVSTFKTYLAKTLGERVSLTLFENKLSGTMVIGFTFTQKSFEVYYEDVADVQIMHNEKVKALNAVELKVRSSTSSTLETYVLYIRNQNAAVTRIREIIKNR